MHLREKLLLFRSDELVALAVDVYDFNLVVILQMLAQLCDVYVHRAGVEIVVVNPDSLQGEVTLQNLIGMAAEQSEQLILFRGELGLLLANGEQLLLCVEGESADMIQRVLLVLLLTSSLFCATT